MACASGVFGKALCAVGAPRSGNVGSGVARSRQMFSHEHAHRGPRSTPVFCGCSSTFNQCFPKYQNCQKKQNNREGAKERQLTRTKNKAATQNKKMDITRDREQAEQIAKILERNAMFLPLKELSRALKDQIPIKQLDLSSEKLNTNNFGYDPR